MRLTFFGHQLLAIDLDVSIGPDAATDEPEFESYQDCGVIGSERITGEHNGWEKSPNGYDEPSEGDEGRIGFGRR